MQVDILTNSRGKLVKKEQMTGSYNKYKNNNQN
jgi:hypothetical protein